MDNKVNAWLEDILRSIDEIFEFIAEKQDFSEFIHNPSSQIIS